MKLEALFKSAVAELAERGIMFAVAGGFATGLYRREPRVTMDVDISILTESRALQAAQEVIRALGLEPGVAREADLAGGPMFAIRRGRTKACMVVGRPQGDPSGGVDILLPAIPWVENAVQRAQDNKVDFGFGPVPALTLEDVILSKLWALTSAQLRAKDLDDLQSIFEGGHDPDLAYLAGEMRRLELTVPRKAEPFLPDIILKVSRHITRTSRRQRRAAHHRRGGDR